MSDAEPSPTPVEQEAAADAELARVLEICLSDIEAGHSVDVGRLLADHPSVAPRLKVCLAGMQLLARQDQPTLSTSPV